MILKSHLFLRFFLTEILNLKSKFLFIMYFFKRISISKLIIFYLTKKNYPFRNKDINEYLKKNEKNFPDLNLYNKKKILVDLTLGSHPLYAINNCLIGKELSKLNRAQITGLIKKYDYESYFIAFSFGIKNFIFIGNESFLTRILYFFKATNLISENNIEKNLIKLKYKNFSLGMVAYEHTFRNFIKKSITKKENFLFYISISRALFALKNYKKIFYNNNFLSFVLGELQYIPYRIFFNTATKEKIPVFAKLGGNVAEDISVRIYRKTKDANSIKSKISKEMVNFLINKSNPNFKKKVNKYFEKINSSTRQIGLEKQLLNFGHLEKPKIIDLKNNLSFSNYFNLNNKRKNILILPHVISDNLFSSEWTLFSTPLAWLVETLNKIKKINNVNWIIKPHPSESAYNLKLNTENIFNRIIKKKENNIKLLKKNIIIKDIHKHVACVLTSHGSPGYEYTGLGIPVITAADAPYSNFNFTYQPKSKKNYFHLIKNIHKIRKPDKNKIYRAKLYWYTNKQVIRSKNSLLPLFDSHKNFNQKKFWRFANKHNSTKNNNFSKNFRIQVNNNNRHTINYKTIDNKNYDNLKLNDT